MKHIIYLVTLSILLFTACNKQEQAETKEQYAGYIFFSHSVLTKATLIDDKRQLKDQSIGVVGYKYDNEWDENIEPNVFGDNVPQEVTCDQDGYGSYSPLQGWSSSKKYAFFAYYPIDIDIVDKNGNPYSSGTPAVKYSLNADDLRSDMVDVMVSEPYKDLNYNSVNGGNVQLTFSHPLSALGIKVTNSTSATITITSATLELSEIKYSDIIIPLDGTAVKTTAAQSPISASIDLNIPSAGETFANGSDEVADKLIFIPQSENISVSVKVNYTRQYEGTAAQTGTFESSALKTSLVKGTKHLIHLNFTETTVNATIQSGAWKDPIEVNNEFN
jgi:hypothetical protein